MQHCKKTLDCTIGGGPILAAALSNAEMVATKWTDKLWHEDNLDMQYSIVDRLDITLGYLNQRSAEQSNGRARPNGGSGNIDLDRIGLRQKYDKQR